MDWDCPTCANGRCHWEEAVTSSPARARERPSSCACRWRKPNAPPEQNGPTRVKKDAEKIYGLALTARAILDPADGVANERVVAFQFELAAHAADLGVHFGRRQLQLRGYLLGAPALTEQ